MPLEWNGVLLSLYLNNPVANPEFGARGETPTGCVSVHHTPVRCTGCVHWSGLIGSMSLSLSSTRALGDPFCSHSILRRCRKNSDGQGFEEPYQGIRVAFLIAGPDLAQEPQSWRKKSWKNPGSQGTRSQLWLGLERWRLSSPMVGRRFVFASERREWEVRRTGGGGGECLWVFYEKTEEGKYRCCEERPQTKCCLEHVSRHLDPLEYLLPQSRVHSIIHHKIMLWVESIALSLNMVRNL